MPRLMVQGNICGYMQPSGMPQLQGGAAAWGDCYDARRHRLPMSLFPRLQSCSLRHRDCCLLIGIPRFFAGSHRHDNHSARRQSRTSTARAGTVSRRYTRWSETTRISESATVSPSTDPADGRQRTAPSPRGRRPKIWACSGSRRTPRAASLSLQMATRRSSRKNALSSSRARTSSGRMARTKRCRLFSTRSLTKYPVSACYTREEFAANGRLFTSSTRTL